MQNSPFIGKIKQIPKMEKKVFKPYIPAEKNIAELTVTSIIIGILLTIIFGAANAYLGLRVGKTVSASIPAAVVSMAIIRLILKRNSILENNIVQTIGSAGESLAAGCIFTMPAFFLWLKDGVMDVPSLVELTLIALFGGILGVLFMIPLRDAFIVKEHSTLPYPEGTACAKVLLAGEGILGIALAGIAICKLSDTINLSNIINTGAIGGAVLFILLGAAIYYVGQKKRLIIFLISSLPNLIIYAMKLTLQAMLPSFERTRDFSILLHRSFLKSHALHKFILMKWEILFGHSSMEQTTSIPLEI